VLFGGGGIFSEGLIIGWSFALPKWFGLYVAGILLQKMLKLK